MIGAQSIIGAGALVTKGTRIHEGSLGLGSPAKVVRTLADDERQALKTWADKYVKVAAGHKKRFASEL